MVQESHELGSADVDSMRNPNLRKAWSLNDIVVSLNNFENCVWLAQKKKNLDSVKGDDYSFIILQRESEFNAS